MNFLKAVFMLFILLLFLASCLPTSQAPLPVETPTQPLTQAPTEPVPTPQDAPLLPPQAAQEAVGTLAAQLDVPVDQVTIAQIDEEDWPDGCLGLATDDEMCTEAIVPGFRVILRAGEAVHEFRTNRDGSVVREVTSSEEDLTGRAAELLVRLSGLALDRIQVTGLEQRDWPNSCLGVEAPEEMCLAVITPGYRIRYQVEGESYVVHTTADLSHGRLMTAPSGMDVALKVRVQVENELNRELAEIRLVDLEAVDWPNACLGVQEPYQSCAEVITPGYRVVLAVGSDEYIFHTDETGGQIIQASRE
jgi:hypothetical protein